MLRVALHRSGRQASKGLAAREIWKQGSKEAEGQGSSLVWDVNLEDMKKEEE